MELLNINKKNIFLLLIVSLFLVACESTKYNFNYSTIDDTDNISFKAKVSEFDIYIPQVQILNYDESELKSFFYKIFKNRFDIIFKAITVLPAPHGTCSMPPEPACSDPLHIGVFTYFV